MEFKIIHFDEIDSTNTFLKQNYNAYLEGTVITTDYQKQGYGRMGRVWVDQKQKNLTFSLLLYPKFEKTILSQITPLTGVSLFKLLKETVPNLSIKWPNDLLAGTKKIAGILTEAIFNGNDLKALIIGIGINVNSTNFPQPLADKTTSIVLETNQEVDKDLLLDEILASFKKHYLAFLKGDRSYLKVFKENFRYLHQEVDIIQNEVIKRVKIIDVLDNGNLLVESSGKTYEVTSGEISLNR